MLVARAACSPPAPCVHWAAKLCWAVPQALLLGLSKGELDLGGQGWHRALAAAVTPTVRSVHGEGPASLQHSCLTQVEHLFLTLVSRALKLYSECLLCSPC